MRLGTPDTIHLFLNNLSMFITWHGLSCFRIQTKETTLLFDPFGAITGLTPPRLQADVIIFSSPEDPLIPQAQKSQGMVIDHAGEYEVRGVVFSGTTIEQTVDGKSSLLTLTTVTAEDVIIGHLGALAREFNDVQLEQLKDVDVLLIPVGGKPVLSATQAVEMVSRIEPRVVIPCYYKIPGLKLSLASVDAFAKELGKKVETQEKLRIVKKDLPEEDMQLVVLKP